MWIASKYGFFSIVKKSPQEWHVRARVREDLQNLIDAIFAAPRYKIECWPGADYRWRFIVEEGRDFLAIYEALGESVDYPNFKSEVAKLPTQRAKLPAYHEIWHLMAEFQARPNAGR